MALTNSDPATVVLDLDTVDPADGDLQSYLIGLLELPDFRLLRYRDEGPPVADLQTHEHFGPHAVGWLTLKEPKHPTYDLVAEVTHTTDPERITNSVVWGGDLLSMPLHYATERLDHSTEEQTQQLRRDLILGRAGEAANALVLVTNRDVLTNPIPGLETLRYSCTALTPRAALSFAGFWLRARGEYVVHAGTGNTIGRTDRALFYTLAAQVVLPAAWRWGEALQAAGSPELPMRLLQTQRSRIMTALKARDRSWAAGLSMSDTDARDEGLDCVIDAALNLMGAFDATARLLEALNPTGTADVNVAWQKPDWVKRQHRRLPGLVDAARRHQPVFDIVRGLRNTIHGTGIHTVLVKGTYANADEAYLALPTEDTESLRRAFTDSGGFDTWQVKEFYPGHLHADPDRLIDEMIIRSAAALDEMMTAGPIEALLGHSGSVATAPPDQGVFRQRHLKNVESQLGLKLPHTQGDSNAT